MFGKARPSRSAISCAPTKSVELIFSAIHKFLAKGLHTIIHTCMVCTTVYTVLVFNSEKIP